MANVPFSAQELMKWSGAIFLAALEGFVIYNIVFNRKWDLSRLLCAEDGSGSMSRFQLVIFTFAIAGGYVYLWMQNGSLPVVDAGSMALLGISGGTYAISKGIQASRDEGLAGAPPPPAPPPPAPAAPAAPPPAAP